MTEWTIATIERLEALWAEDLSTAEIGRRMGISKNAIVGKAHRLNLPARPSPIHRSDTPRPVRPGRTTGPTLAPLPSMHAPPVVVAPVQPASAPVRAAPAHVPPAPRLVRTGAPSCLFPMWGDKEHAGPSPRFCDAPRERGSYCEEHASRCYAGTHNYSEDQRAAAGIRLAEMKRAAMRAQVAA